MARALDMAAQRWPDDPRSKLLLRLVRAGSVALEQEHTDAARNRLAAVDATSGKYGDTFAEDYLTTLRQDWPE